MAESRDLGWLPTAGVHLTHVDLVEMMMAMRAIVGGTELDEPNRSHAVSVVRIVVQAIDREAGAP